jgi:hypothetical protein
MKHRVRSTPQARRVATALLLSCSLSLLASVGGAGSNKEPAAACSAVRVGLLQVAKGSEFESACCQTSRLLLCLPDAHACTGPPPLCAHILVGHLPAGQRTRVCLASYSYLSPNHRAKVGQVASSLSSFCRTLHAQPLTRAPHTMSFKVAQWQR